jgi:hypothetical protein
VTQAFCSTCTRTRLSTDGKLYSCLFGQSGHNLRALMRSGKSDRLITRAIGLIWNQREDRQFGSSALRTEETASNEKVEMSYIGGRHCESYDVEKSPGRQYCAGLFYTRFLMPLLFMQMLGDA